MDHGIQPTVEADFVFATTEPFQLERGGLLQPVTLRYAIYGDVARNRERVILVPHALSGSARVADWWPALFSAEGPFDLSEYCVVGVNIIGSCYGSTGPTSINPQTQRSYGPEFPLVTIGDIVGSQAVLLDHLGIQRLYAVIGSSIGGMQALEWALRFPERVARCIVIGTAPLGAMGLGLNHLQRQAIWNDPAWNNGWYTQQPAKGLGAARAIAMLSYKSSELFEERYGRKPNRNGEDPFNSIAGRFDIAGYLDYQQRIFLDRFDANTYITITKLMDTWDIPPAGSTQYRAVATNGVEVNLVGISSDWLFPASDVRKLNRRLTQERIPSHYFELTSSHGHDAFLADPRQLFPILRSVLASGKAADSIHACALE